MPCALFRNLVSPGRRLGLALGFTALSAAGADPSGIWSGSMTGRDGNQREVSFRFAADGPRLTGSMLGPTGNEIEISDGKVQGEEVTFKVVLNWNGRPAALLYRGRLTGGELRLKMQRVGAPRAIEMLLKKAGA
ncbi:MAG: hypothetical protein ACK58M_06470 [Acidobacteriota bacterium]|jgi:hypothetical protein|nr:hypothetical protein [Bryobacteraceae bacterium CoA2 C42]